MPESRFKKRDPGTGVFPVKFAKNFKNIFFTEHFQAIASALIRFSSKLAT